MTSETPRYIGPFKRTTTWTLGAVMSGALLAIWVYLWVENRRWYQAVIALAFLGAGIGYSVALRRERKYDAEHERL